MGRDAAGVRVGPAYEAEREAALAAAAGGADARRVELGHDLVLVLATGELVRTALEERLRAEGIVDADAVGDAARAIAGIAGSTTAVAATLLVDAADPVALASRAAALAGVAERVRLAVGGDAVTGQVIAGDLATGAWQLRFELTDDVRAAALDGARLSVAVEHPAAATEVVLDGAQAAALRADLRR